jgi:cyanophycinase-like exopeptidase
MKHPAIGTPGPVVFFGSGETSPSGQRIFDYLFKQFLSGKEEQGVPDSPRVAVLETPAGFELNSPQVAGRVVEFLEHHLQNYDPQVQVIPARKRGTAYSPDNFKVVEPLLSSDLVFMGPGSPSYAVRHLRGSLAWHMLVARHRLGGALALASAATVALGALALPVYEIYKAGEDAHWIEGLDLLGPYGLPLVMIPHWNNSDGGDELDTSRCFMGRSRFDRLAGLLPPGLTIVGIDEKTGLFLDLDAGICRVIGKDGVTVIRKASMKRFREGAAFSLQELGDFRLPEQVESGLPAPLWERALESTGRKNRPASPSPEVLALVEERQAAREGREWSHADALRRQIARLGWQIVDTEEGPRLEEVD